MFDIALQKMLKPIVHKIGQALASLGISANMISIAGALLVIPVCGAILYGHYSLALCFILLNRTIDGLDGAVAQINGPTQFGGYLDSLADFFFYAAIPLAFAWAEPDNAKWAALLLASFMVTGVSFLAFAAIASDKKAPDQERGPKAFLYTIGMMEGTETIITFTLMCLFPAYFAWIVIGASLLCALTIAQRLKMAADLLD